MTLSLISEPLKTDADVTDSNVLAVRTQARYEFLRSDFVETTDIVNVADSGGFVQVTTVAAASTLVTVGDSIYLSADSVYDDQGVVTAVNANDFVTTIVFVSALTPIVDGYLNNFTKFPQYRVEFQFKDIGTNIVLKDLFYSPKSDGTLVLDLAEAFEFLLTLSTGLRVNNIAITPEFREVFTGSSASFTALTIILAIRSKRQLLQGVGGSFEGSNLIKFLLSNSNTDKVLLPKLRKVWQNWQGDTQYIVDSGQTGRVGATIRIKVDRLDINKTFIANLSSITQTFIQAEIRGINLKTTAAITANFLQVYFQDEPGQTIDLAAREDYEVLEECENPIMISWVNSLGAADTYLFSFNQEVEEVTDAGDVIVPPIIDDISQEDIGIIRRNIDTSQRITCFADHVTDDEIRALHELKHSEKVEVFLDKGGQFNKIDVVVEDVFSTNYNTRSFLNLFTVKIRFPDNFDFFDAKLY